MRLTLAHECGFTDPIVVHFAKLMTLKRMNNLTRTVYALASQIQMKTDANLICKQCFTGMMGGGGFQEFFLHFFPGPVL